MTLAVATPCTVNTIEHRRCIGADRRPNKRAEAEKSFFFCFEQRPCESAAAAMDPELVGLSVIVIQVFMMISWYAFYLVTRRVECSEDPVVLENNLLDRFFALWSWFFGLASFFSLMSIRPGIILPWRIATGVSFLLVAFPLAMWYRGMVSRNVGALGGVLAGTGLYVFRAYVTGSPAVTIWSQSSVLVALVFSMSCGLVRTSWAAFLILLVASRWMPVAEVPWVTQEFMSDNYGQSFKVIISFLVLLMVSHLLRDVDIRVEALMRLAKSKDLVLATVSHEIRSPLNVIIGAVQLLSMDGELHRSLSPEKRTAIRETMWSATHSALLLNLVVNNVMAQNETREERSVAQQVDTKAFLHALTVLVRGLVFFKPALQIKVKRRQLPAELRIAARPLLQVVLNLASNAVKFQESGEIEVTLYCTDDRKTLTVEVADCGRGVSPDFAENGLFEAFRREVGTTSVTGSGLGLSICKKLARQMGGELGYHRNGQQGSVFWLSVPMHDYAPTVWSFAESGWFAMDGSSLGQQGARNAVADELNERRRVGGREVEEEEWPALIVDDSKMNQKIFHGFLTNLGVRRIDTADELSSFLLGFCFRLLTLPQRSFRAAVAARVGQEREERKSSFRAARHNDACA